MRGSVIDSHIFYLLVLLTGCVAGFLAGLLGIGGGLIIVPVIAWLLAVVGHQPDTIMHIALGTSLASIIFTSVSSIRAHHQRGAVLWPVSMKMSGGILVGAFLGAMLAGVLNTSILKIIFGVVVLTVALQMATSWRVNAHSQVAGLAGLLFAGSIIGAISSIVGIGGGTMSVPYLMWHGVVIRQAVATAAANGLPIAIAGAAGYALTGYSAEQMAHWRLGYIDLPILAMLVSGSVLLAPVGARMAHTIDTRKLKRIFALFLAIIGLRMLLGELV